MVGHYMSERMRVTASLMVAMIVLTWSPASATRGRRCGAGCQRRGCLAKCERSFTGSRHDCRDACIPDDLKDERDSCRAKGGLVFNSCTPGCLVPVPGRCTLTHECV